MARTQAKASPCLPAFLESPDPPVRPPPLPPPQKMMSGAHGTLIPSAQRLVWAAKQGLGKAALGALFA